MHMAYIHLSLLTCMYEGRLELSSPSQASWMLTRTSLNGLQVLRSSGGTPAHVPASNMHQEELSAECHPFSLCSEFGMLRGRRSLAIADQSSSKLGVADTLAVAGPVLKGRSVTCGASCNPSRLPTTCQRDAQRKKLRKALDNESKRKAQQARGH